MTVRATVDAVSVELGGARILERVSLECAPGEFVTLLGPSGSGKTTTLNVIAGLVRHLEGHVLFDGQPIDDLPPYDRDIGIVFQSYALFPHMSVGDNIAFPLLTRKVARAERRRRVDEMLDLVHLPGMAARSIGSLSGGQQQRVALARAIAAHPRLLLLDEPMAALDKGLRDAMQLELKRIQKETGITTVAVTHDQTEALTMSDRIAIMHEGRLEQMDTPNALYKHPQTLFVARFLGEANLLDLRRDEVPALGLRLPGAGSGTALVRPEDFRLAAGEQGPGVVSGTVETVAYQGTRYRVSVRAGEVALIASAPSSVAPEALAPGSAVTLACDPAEVHVIPHSLHGMDPDALLVDAPGEVAEVEEPQPGQTAPARAE